MLTNLRNGTPEDDQVVMNHLRFYLPFLVGLIISLPACKDQMTPTKVSGPGEGSSAEIESSSRSVVTPPPGISLISRFAIDIEVNGSLKPSTPISLSIATTGLQETKQALITLHLPEIDAARLSSFGPQFTLPVGQSLQPEASRSVALGIGQQHRFGHIIQIPEPGYYRIDVTVRRVDQSSGGISSSSAPYVKNVGQKTIWVWITPEGGKVTPTFDESLFPNGSLVEPGPLRWLNDAQSEGAEAKGDAPLYYAGAVRAAKQILRNAVRNIRKSLHSINSSYPVEYQAVYWDPIDDIHRPISNAAWEASWEDYSDPYNIDVEWDYGKTDENGFFTVDCPGLYESSKDGFVQARGAVRVEGPGNLGGSPVNVSSFSVGYDDCQEPTSRTTGAVISETPHVFHVMSEARVRSNSWFGGYTRGTLTVFVEHQSTDCSKPDNSCYKDGSDEIHLLSDSTARLSSGDHVWGEWGTFIQNHEYGHAFHNKALVYPAGGIDCPSTGHSIGGPSSRSCAFGEGFADFFGAWVGGPELIAASGSDYLFESNPYRDNGDGLLIEGAVAGFLYDLVDAASDPNGSNGQSTGSDDDPVAFPGVFIGDVITTCSFEGGWIDDPNGIDQFIYCAERALDAEAVGSQYSSHWRSYSNFSVGGADPAGWSKQNVRDLWLYNLYNQ